jgi:hypothetical protein
MIPSPTLAAPPKFDHAFEWIWTAWLLSLVVSFAALEGEAVHLKKTTLSSFVWQISKAWPPFPWAAGIIVGFLGAHFWWQNQGLRRSKSSSTHNYPGILSKGDLR